MIYAQFSKQTKPKARKTQELNLNHILQKQGALETGLSLSRRQMLRQQSYKIAQTQQILPPLPFPLSESESEDLLAFQQIVENPSTSKKLIKTTHLHNSASLSPSLSPQPPVVVTASDSAGMWNNLPSSLQASCQISDASSNVNTAVAAHELFHQPLFHQVYYY